MCPALCVLKVAGSCLWEARYVFPHLTRLELQHCAIEGNFTLHEDEGSDDEADGGDWPEPQQLRCRLPVVAPKLEVLASSQGSIGLARAAAGLTALRELDLNMGRPADANALPDARLWHSVLGTLPQLSSLVFKVSQGGFLFAPDHGAYDAAGGLFEAIDSLQRCPRLSRLDLAAIDVGCKGFASLSAQKFLRRVGEAAGGGLVSLTLTGGKLKHERRDTWRGALARLPKLFPLLEALSLTVESQCTDQQELEASLLRFASALAQPSCTWPSLRHVSVWVSADVHGRCARLEHATLERVQARCAQLSLGQKLEIGSVLFPWLH